VGYFLFICECGNFGGTGFGGHMSPNCPECGSKNVTPEPTENESDVEVEDDGI